MGGGAGGVTEPGLGGGLDPSPPSGLEVPVTAVSGARGRSRGEPGRAVVAMVPVSPAAEAGVFV